MRYITVDRYSFHSTPNLVDGQMKSTVSLDSRIFDCGNFKTPPVAPPRKKRSTLKKGSTLPTSFGDGSVPNGFKDVFINGGVSKVFKREEIKRVEKEEDVVQTRAASECEDEMSRERIRELKVGNKKTDKFFGESLSDHLSNEPVLRIDESKIDEAKDETDVNYTADKKLFFLMNMLDQDHDDENDDIKCEISQNNEEPIDRKRYDEEDDDALYKGKLPVEEPLFIARKKVIKHICDDDDHMHHHHFHSHEKESSDHVDDHSHDKESSETVVLRNQEKESSAIAPPKPDRDFSKYHSNPLEESALKEAEELQTKARVKKTISRESLPTPPEAPKRKSGVGSSPGTPTITIESIDFITSNENEKTKVEPIKVQAKIESEAAPVETKVKIETKYPAPLKISQIPKYDPIPSDETPTPSTPIFTHEIMDHVFKKAYGFHGFHPEDTEHNHDDGSNLVAPRSKLTTRKISVTRKISTESQASNDGEFARSNELLPPGSPRKKISFSDDPLSKISESNSAAGDTREPPRTPPASPMKNRDYQQILKAASMKDIIDEIYSKNSEIMIEFQSYLEKSIETEPVINVDEEKEFLKAKGITDNEFSRTPEPKLEHEEEIDDNQSYSDSFESTDTEQETITEMKKATSRLPKFNMGRRESIEDVDNWFNNHLKMDQNESDVCGFMEGTEPSSGTPTYDQKKIFPFGPTITGRRDSSSNEFFAGLPQTITRTNIGPLRESESSVSEDESRPSNDHRQQSPDHSTLLKFLDKEAKDII